MWTLSRMIVRDRGGLGVRAKAAYGGINSIIDLERVGQVAIVDLRKGVGARFFKPTPKYARQSSKSNFPNHSNFN